MPKHQIQSLKTKTTDYTVQTEDDIILVDATSGNITITLPACSGVSKYSFTIKRLDTSSNTVTVDADASETIDGEATQTLSSYDAMKIESDGTSWYII